ncbi:MAG: DUF2127 domain-containing protein [Rhodoferax sp.]|nr:DUF2127 domain-containing protein [Rhodoferax sp.]
MDHPTPAAHAAHNHAVAKRRALRAIAIFEASKGIAALVAIIGVLNLTSHDAKHLAIELIGRFGLRPQGHYPSLLLHYAGLLPGANLQAVTLLAVCYVTLRFAEAYGLWNDRVWAEWLAALSGGLYIPFELQHLLDRPSVISGLVLAGNVFVVGLMAYLLWRRRGASASPQ